MGLLASKLSNLMKMFKKDPCRVCMLGLDNAGKTTAMLQLKTGETTSTRPTVGFNVEIIKLFEGLTVTVWDVGGQSRIRELWKHYYKDSDGIIFVVDSTDSARFKEANVELQNILKSDDIDYVPLLILANKMDLPQAEALSTIADGLSLSEIKVPQNWHLQACSAKTGEGIYDGIKTFGRMLKEYKRIQKQREKAKLQGK